MYLKVSNPFSALSGIAASLEVTDLSIAEAPFNPVVVVTFLWMGAASFSAAGNKGFVSLTCSAVSGLCEGSFSVIMDCLSGSGISFEVVSWSVISVIVAVFLTSGSDKKYSVA